MSRLITGLLLIVLFAGTAAAELARPFGEFWNNLSYYDTNLERKGFASLLGRFEGKVGLELFDSPLQVYGAYYATAAQSQDYWDNAVYYGPGLRFRPLAGFKGSGWLDEWLPDVKVFYETLNSSFFKDAVSGEANKRTDTRYGLDLWHEWNLNNPDLNNFWGELWANYSSRSTNFSWTDFKGTVLYFQPKLGRHLGRGIEPYIKADLTTSSQPDYWLNVADYGIGIRFEPWRRDYPSNDSILKKFKMFAELLSVNYLKDKPADPNLTVERDARFGVEFSYGR
ncbi:MAG: hypothetical protein WC903_03765 [Candidatus Margulisiibacteriota bacterium]